MGCVCCCKSGLVRSNLRFKKSRSSTWTWKLHPPSYLFPIPHWSPNPKSMETTHFNHSTLFDRRPFLKSKAPAVRWVKEWYRTTPFPSSIRVFKLRIFCIWGFSKTWKNLCLCPLFVIGFSKLRGKKLSFELGRSYVRSALYRIGVCWISTMKNNTQLVKELSALRVFFFLFRIQFNRIFVNHMMLIVREFLLLGFLKMFLRPGGNACS